MIHLVERKLCSIVGIVVSAFGTKNSASPVVQDNRLKNCLHCHNLVETFEGAVAGLYKSKCPCQRQHGCADVCGSRGELCVEVKDSFGVDSMRAVGMLSQILVRYCCYFYHTCT
jgi:hypothetical protein